MKCVSFEKQNKYCIDSERICTTAGKKRYLLLWAPQHVDSCQHLLTFLITIRVAKKATEELVAKWEKMDNRNSKV